MNIKKIEKAWKSILAEIGENPEREGLLETPKRIAKMYKEIFRGYDLEQAPNITTFENGHDGIIYDNMIIDTGDFYSMCEHHCAPFFGQYFFGYIPDKKIVGLSKIARLVDYYGARMQVQERLGKNVVDYLQNILQPKGMILILKAKHTCKSMRGVKKDGIMTTAIVTGIFQDDLNARQEFLQLIK